MRDVQMSHTVRYDEHQNRINLPKENAELMCNFLDVAGENAAADLVAQFATKANMIILCYSINSDMSF